MTKKLLTPAIIAEITGGTYCGAYELRDEEITGAVIDSREAGPGALFVCLPGERADGHDYAAAAALKGAVCCLAQRPVDAPHVLVSDCREAFRQVARHYRQQLSAPVVGVIGSVGKTSAKEAISAVLSRNFSVHKTSKNLNNELGVPMTLLGIDRSHQAAVVEMGISDFGEMTRLAAMVEPDICVMTNIGACHLETLGDLQGVFRAKSEVFPYIRRDGAAILNGDDAILAAADPGVKTVLYGLGKNCQVRAADISSRGLEGIDFTLHTPAGSIKAYLPAYGLHLVYAALCAAAVGLELGMTPADIAAGLGDYRPISGRANPTFNGTFTVIDDCYNAGPDSVSAALRSLAMLSGRRTACLGDMLELGTASQSSHRMVGALAAELGIDALYCCGERSRDTVAAYTEAGGKNGRHFPDRDALIAAARELLQPGDTVLIKASHSMGFDKVAQALSTI